MIQRYLLPHKYKKWGWVMLGLWLLFIIVLSFNSIFVRDQLDKIAPKLGLPNDDFAWRFMRIISFIFLTGAALLVLLTKEKREDEFLTELRVSSLIWAIVLTYILTLVFMIISWTSIWFSAASTFTFPLLLIIFILRFNYLLHFKYKSVE